VVFKADYDKIEFQKYSYDVSVTSSPLCQIKISGYASGLNVVYTSRLH